MTPKHSGKLRTFANALKGAREATEPRLTQVQLAHDLGVDPMTVSRWERGESEPNRWLWRTVVGRFPNLARFAPSGALDPLPEWPRQDESSDTNSDGRPSGTGTDG